MPDFTEVICETCGAEEGHPCTTSTGNVSNYTHTRRRDWWKEQNPTPNVEERWIGPTDVTFQVRVFEDTHTGKDKPTLWMSIELNVHGRREKIESPVNPKAIMDLNAQLSTTVIGLLRGQLVEVKNAK